MKYELTSKRIIPKVFLKKIQEWVDQRPQSISDKKVDEGTFSFDFFFNWDSLHAILIRKRSTKRSEYRANLFRENLQLKKMPVNSRLKTT